MAENCENIGNQAEGAAMRKPRKKRSKESYRKMWAAAAEGRRKRNAEIRAAREAEAKAEELAAAAAMPEWDRLVRMAEMALDENGEERLAKLRTRAMRWKKRMAERGEEELADVDAMRRALCAYYVDMTGAGPIRGIKKVFAAEGASLGDFMGGARNRHADLNLVFEYIHGLMRDTAEAEAVETASLAQLGQRRLLTEENCGLNQRAVEVSLKATMRNVYGDRGDGGGESKDKAAISYSFPNMTLNWIVAAPGAMPDAGRAAIEAAKAAAIDVEADEG